MLALVCSFLGCLVGMQPKVKGRFFSFAILSLLALKNSSSGEKLILSLCFFGDRAGKSGCRSKVRKGLYFSPSFLLECSLCYRLLKLSLSLDVRLFNSKLSSFIFLLEAVDNLLNSSINLEFFVFNSSIFALRRPYLCSY